MKISELLEASIGAQSSVRKMTAPNVTTRDLSAPWVKAQMVKAGKFRKKFEEAKTPKEKFDLVYKKVASNPTAVGNILRITRGSIKFSIDSYDPATGEIKLIHSIATKKTRYLGNVNDFSYAGAQRSSGVAPRVYYFTPGELVKKDTWSTYDNTVDRTGGKGMSVPDNPFIPKVSDAPVVNARVIKNFSGDD